MKKKFLALVLTLAMVLSLVPVTALATDGTSDTTTKDVVYGHYDGSTWTEDTPTRTDGLDDKVTVDKTATKAADNQYNVTLTVQMKHKETAVPPSAAATVLVIDKSGSMNDNNRLPAAKTAAINFLKSYSGFSDSDFDKDGKLKNNVSDKNLNRYVSLVTFNDSASVKQNWIDVSTKNGYNKLFKSINKIEASDGTNLDDALRLAKTQMQSGRIAQIDQSKRNVIALTDGVPTYYVSIGTGWFGTDENVSQHGNYGCPGTNDATAKSADALKADGNAVYTVCFGAANDICWTKDSVHVKHTFKDDEKHTTDGPTVGKFLEENIATLSTSEKKYAYNADDADGLYQAFAAITQTITEGLNEGVVTDGLPAGVSCTDNTFGEDRTLTWNLKPNEADVTKEGEYNVYTYTKTYKVNVDPATVKTVEVGGVNYAPLNMPTILTVQNNGKEVEIPFPIPAGKVTYSLTDFEKALVTNQNKPDGLTIPEGVTIPATVPVVISDEGVTLLYKITVKGDKGAKFIVRDDGATLVSPKDDSITENTANSTFSGAVGNTGETVFYVSKQFTKSDIDSSSDTQTVSNTATIAPGDNANGPADDEKTQTVTTPAKEPDPQTYTVTYRWAEGEKPSDANTLLPQGGTFTVDQKHTVADIPRSSVTTNDAGKTGTWSCTWDKSGTIEGTANQEIVITGTWTFTENKPTTGNLIVKKVVSGESLTLNDLPTGSKEFKITVSGNGESKELSLKDSGVNVNESKTEATWTIPGLDPGEYTVSESNADVTGYDCTATYNATNGATVIVNRDASAVQNQPATDAQTVTVAADSTSTMTVTNKYTKQEVVPPTPADPVEWDVSCSKIASGLMKNSNGDWTTDVTLSIPSSEKQLVSDVLFILDESSCSESVKASVNSMLDALYEQIENSGAKIKVGAVQFRGNVTTLPLTELTENTKTEITSFMSSRPEVGGTNMSAGLLKAQKMLDDDTSVMDGRKYVILVSDGITYIWDDETTDAQENLGVNFANADAPNNAMLAGPDGWDVKYGESYIPENWESHFNGIDSMMSTTIQNKASNYERGDNATIGKPFVAYGEKEQYTSTVDIALYKSYNAYKALQEKYNTYAVCSGVEKDMTDFPFGPSFMTYLADGKNVTFNSIQNDILYAVSAGSTVTDIIGSKFSFEGIKSLTVGKQELTATKSGENTWYFGNDNTASESNYRFKVVYNSQDHQFVWTINEKVSNFAPVQLTYTVKLTKPETAAGTYGVTDLNGDEKVDDTGAAVDKTKALYTNQEAKLVPKDSNGNTGVEQTFPMPSVFYTIKGSSGGHSGGGTVTIPDDVPTGLNGKDHYAYVVGYPDGMVYPQKNITRAEVATIFFRLLTDETREANMTKSNSYNDMKDGAWYTCAVSTLSKMGIIKGYEDGSFKPDASISRAEFAAIAARFDPDGDKTPATFSDVSSHWAKDEISIAANHGWIKGYEDGSFKPDQKITRAETMTLVNRVLKRLPETKDDLHKDMKTWPDNQNESAWFYLAVQEATNSHYQKLKKDGTHETWESMRETRDWAALEK